MKPRFRKVPYEQWDAVIGDRVDWRAFADESKRLYMAGELHKVKWRQSEIDGKKAVMRSPGDLWFIEVSQ